MSAISLSKFIITDLTSPSSLLPTPSPLWRFSSLCPSPFSKSPSCPHLLSSTQPRKNLVFAKSSEEAELSAAADEWLKKLPEKKQPLYAHSLPCVEAWLRQLGFYQSKNDRPVWLVEKPDWHAQISLDVTDLYIRYLKSGPGNLEKDVERRFIYALSREDIENAILEGP
ncbi:uncharacterized protein LOC130752447 [Actinidia eriantha]|uniref:uncharacterized protein LOC130752447 n=1 Tax=Actinidia eriantha TaxID=165200 RepID=UPI002585B970|nr:uncharacterized protein LOC130752447 [Actinidia eriantha]